MSDVFAQLDRRVQRWIYEQNWTELRDIQAQAIPLLLAAQQDVIIAAGTASGKTEAAFLPICSRIVARPTRSIQALYVGPLKALINDQFSRLDLLCEGLGIEVHRWHGDVSASAKMRTMKEPAGILLITPESLEAVFVNRGAEIRRMFAGLEFIVVDELHAFLGTERGRQLQSLAHRLDRAIESRPARVGLSATLGDLALAAAALRPDAPKEVVLVRSSEGSAGLRMRVYGYVNRPVEEGVDGTGSADIAIASSLYETLRGGRHLVFPNSRTSVEFFGDRLRRACEQRRVPLEFFTHHGSLSKEIREEAERRLKDRDLPCTVVATSTLELGIDVGYVESIAQIGAPPSVASLRQRLGRSGRRGEPAILRVHVAAAAVDERTDPPMRLHPELVQTIAMVELLLERWVEPPPPGAFHFSTLVQQLLSVMTERGGVRAAVAYDLLCGTGPFAAIDPPTFAKVLRSLGERKVIEQEPGGLLLPGELGEQIVAHYSFYAAFNSASEYRVMHAGTVLGTMTPQLLVPGVYVVFAGRRWVVDEVREDEELILVSPAGAARLPLFRTQGGPLVHDVIRRRMREIYTGDSEPVFLDDQALELLRQVRREFSRMGLRESNSFKDGQQTYLFPWIGDSALAALHLLLDRELEKVGVDYSRVAILAEHVSAARLQQALEAVAAREPPPAAELALRAGALEREKYDRFIPRELLAMDYAARELDVAGAYRFIARR